MNKVKFYFRDQNVSFTVTQILEPKSDAEDVIKYQLKTDLFSDELSKTPLNTYYEDMSERQYQEWMIDMKAEAGIK